MTRSLCLAAVVAVGLFACREQASAQPARRVFPHPHSASYVLLNSGRANAAVASSWVAYRALECVARGLPGNCVLDVGPDGQRLTTPITTAYVRVISSDDETQHAIALDDITRAAVGGPPNLPELAAAQLPADIRAKLGVP